MQAFVEGLKREGIDIGKGDSQYGFRMPLPDNKTGDRELVIFRRKIKNGKIRKC